MAPLKNSYKGVDGPVLVRHKVPSICITVCSKLLELHGWDWYGVCATYKDKDVNFQLFPLQRHNKIRKCMVRIIKCVATR